MCEYKLVYNPFSVYLGKKADVSHKDNVTFLSFRSSLVSTRVGGGVSFGS